MKAMVGTYAVFPAPRTGKPKAWYAADMHEVHVYRTKREAIAHADAMHTPETVDWLWHGKDLRREIGVPKRIVDHRSNDGLQRPKTR